MPRPLNGFKGLQRLRGTGIGSGLSLSALSLAANLFTVTASSASAGGTAWYLVNASVTAMTGAAIKAAVQATSPQAYGDFVVSSGVNNETMDLSAVTEGYAVLHVVVEKAGAFSAEAQYEFTYAPAAPPAFVQSLAYSDQGFNTTARLAAPSGIASGNLLIAALSTGSTTTMSTPATGWTLVGTFAHEGAGGNTWIYKKTAAGTEGGTNIDWIIGSNCMKAFTFYEISDATNVEYATNITDLDPPNIAPSGGNIPYIILAQVKQPYCGYQNVTAVPSGYSGFISARTDPANNASSSQVTVGAGYKAVTAASENPGAFTFAGTPDALKRAAFTVAVW
jgi:hypothetical protein